MAKKNNTNDYSNKNYEELEKMSEEIMTKLSSSDLGLDEATKLYHEGKEIIAEMENRLQTLMKEVNDTIEQD